MLKLSKISFFFIAIFLLFFAGCANKINTNQTQKSAQAIKLTMRLPSLRFSDFGFLNQSKKELNLQLYQLGQVFFKLKIKDKICLNSVCYDKKVFNKKFLKNEFYDELLEQILRAEMIFNGSNLSQNECGFSQSISRRNFEIYYEICDEKTRFYEAKSGLRINLEKVKE